MAQVTLNGLYQPSLLTFTDVPNIVKVTENISGSYSQITLNFTGTLAATGNSQYYITILDETIENVLDPTDANNRRFFIADANSTAASVAFALMNCGSLSADFQITYSNSNVYLKAREFGSKLAVSYPVTTNLPSSMFSYSLYNGSVTSDLVQGKIILKLSDNGNEITELVKNWHGNSTSFDISPALSTFAKYGEGSIYTVKVDKMGSNGIYGSVDNIGENVVTYGFKCNDSDRFLPITDRILINNREGLHYTFYNTIPITVLSPSQAASVSWTAYTSNYVQLGTGQSALSPVNGYMSDVTVAIPQSTFNNAYYVDVSYGISTIRYNVIKPLRATEGGFRVYWRNCYGGISFFDFTGSESESLSNSIDTYKENIYHTYDNREIEGLTHIYRNDITKRYTFRSHLIEKDGIKWANELAQ